MEPLLSWGNSGSAAVITSMLQFLN